MKCDVFEAVKHRKILYVTVVNNKKTKRNTETATVLTYCKVMLVVFYTKVGRIERGYIAVFFF